MKYLTKITCPKCNYKDAEKIIGYEPHHFSKSYKITKWFCPKCEYEKETKVEVSLDEASGVIGSENAKGDTKEGEITKGTIIKNKTGCCTIGLIPTILLFLSFITIYPNQKALLSIIDFHNKKTSPILNKLNFKCGFTPSCSEYSKIAIMKYGAIKGGFKSIWRIVRCNSFNKNKGIDYPRN